MGWDSNTPVGTGSWYGLYTIGIFHLACTLDIDLPCRVVRRRRGTRTGFDSNYSEVTLGLNWHPVRRTSRSARRSAATSPASPPSEKRPTRRNSSQFTGGDQRPGQVLITRVDGSARLRPEKPVQPRGFSGTENQWFGASALEVEQPRRGAPVAGGPIAASCSAVATQIAGDGSRLPTPADAASAGVESEDRASYGRAGSGKRIGHGSRRRTDCRTPTRHRSAIAHPQSVQGPSQRKRSR